MDFEDLEKELSKLERPFLNMMLFNLMKKGKLHFIDLSNQYVRYLEDEKKDARVLTNDLAISLIQHRHPDVVGGNTKEDKLNFIHEKAISALRRSRCFPDEFDYMKDVRKIL